MPAEGRPARPLTEPPALHLRSFDRGDGLLGLKPCGPVPPGQRRPLFGARAVPVTLAWCEWPGGPPGPTGPSGSDGAAPTPSQARAAAERLRATGLHPLPAEALQWRGEPALPGAAHPWSLVREADFGAWWAEELPRLRDEGWAVRIAPGFAHAAVEPEGWALRLEPLAGAPGLAGWLLSLGVVVGGETLDLVPMMARLVGHEPRWLDAEALAAIPADEVVRLHAPGGRRIDVPAAPLKAIAASLLDLITAPPRRDARAGGAIALKGWEAQRLQALRTALAGSLASHPSALRDWALQGEAGLALLAGRLAAAGPLHAPAADPPGLGIALRPYQREGLAWLQRLAAQSLAGILADDMGLGKTAQALAHVLAERHAGRLDRPALVVAPASLVGNWQAEAARMTPGLRVLVLQGPRRAIDFARVPAHDLVITSYPLLWRDAMALQRQPWHLVLLDEAQMVKNAGSRTATAARRLNARHRLALTGTPLENHLGELWAQFHFLLPGFLGDARQFQRQWRAPIEKNGETLRAQLLATRVRPFVLRRTRAQVLPELPPLTEQVVRLPLAGAQHALYEGLRLACEKTVRELVERLGWRGAKVGVLQTLLKLRQACCDPRLLRTASGTAVAGPAEPAPAPLPPEGHAAKLDWLRATLPTLAAEGRRMLVFSQFTAWLRLLEPELDALGLPWLALTGELPPARRAALVARYQAGEVPVLLASLKAGGTGLNLTAADTVIHLDPWWNPAVQDQASARAHRLGQARAVWSARLVAAGSIEEKMLALQARKAALAEGLLGDRPLAVDEGDLAALLAPLPAPA